VKPTDANRDPAFDRLIARGLERETDASGTACPDADLLAAWFDRSLSALESERIEAHASSCACCQQVLADLARSEPEVTRAAPTPAPARPWHWHWRWLVPLATAAVVIVVGTRTLRAPGTLQVRAAPPAALGDRPATWVDLQQARPESRPPAQGAAATEAPAVPAARDSVSAGAPAAPRKEVEFARAAPPVPPPAAPDRLAEEKREPTRADQMALPAAANADAPRNMALAESVTVAVTPAPAAPAQAATARTGAPGGLGGVAGAKADGMTEKVMVVAPTPPAPAPPPVAARPASIAREPAALSLAPSLMATSGTGPTGTTATWRYGQGGVIERSTDRGQTWERQASGVTTALAAGSAPTDRVCWIVGERGVVLRTTDGRTWRRLASPTVGDLASVRAFSDSNATIIASDRAEYETTDGGTTWRRRQPDNWN